MPTFRLVAEPIDEAARQLLTNRDEHIEPSVGVRHKLGGQPDLIHALDWPTCPSCGDGMSFYGQLDSLPAVEFALADAGLIYVFVCFGCFEVKATLQSG